MVNELAMQRFRKYWDMFMFSVDPNGYWYITFEFLEMKIKACTLDDNKLKVIGDFELSENGIKWHIYENDVRGQTTITTTYHTDLK